MSIFIIGLGIELLVGRFFVIDSSVIQRLEETVMFFAGKIHIFFSPSYRDWFQLTLKEGLTGKHCLQQLCLVPISHIVFSLI
jgi:hypothetical protein